MISAKLREALRRISRLDTLTIRANAEQQAEKARESFRQANLRDALEWRSTPCRAARLYIMDQGDYAPMKLTKFICRRAVGAAEILAVGEPERGLSSAWRRVVVQPATRDAVEARMPESAFAKYVPVPGDFLIEADGERSFCRKADFERDYVRATQ